MAAIDLAFGGKGKAFDAYRKEILGDEGRPPKGKGLTPAARDFFGGGMSGLIPIIKVPAPAKES